MKIVEGKITAWQQAEGPIPPHQNYRQTVTIEGASGQLITGQIFVKEQNIAKARGEFLKWEVTVDEQHRTKLKRHRDTPYQGGQQSQQGGKPEPDWDKIAEGKVLCNVICAAIQSEQMSCTNEQAAQDLTDFIMGERAQPQPEPQAATPILDALPDDIPF